MPIDFGITARMGGALFAEPIIWRHGGADITVSAIIDRNPTVLDPGEGPGLGTTIVTLSLLAERLPGLDRRADRFVFNGRTWKIQGEPFLDAGGLLMLTMEFAS